MIICFFLFFFSDPANRIRSALETSHKDYIYRFQDSKTRLFFKVWVWYAITDVVL